MQRRAGQVTAVVCAALDATADARLRRCVATLEEAGLRRGTLRHRPHLTLSAATVDAAAVPEVVEAAAGVAGLHGPVDLLLDRVGTFPSGAVWLGPQPSPELAALQADADAALLAGGWPRAFGPRSAPSRWVPHATVATRVRRPDVAKAVELAGAARGPARVEALAVLLVGGTGDVAVVPLT